MPGQILPLRVLSSSVSFSTMKLGASIQSSRGISVFSRVFPFKLKYLGISRKVGGSVLLNDGYGVRRFSSGSFRDRNGGGRSNAGRSSEFSRSRGVDRGEFQGGRFGGRGGGQAKSLIEDEDELSDWISELKTDSIRVGLKSDSEDDSGMGRVGNRDTGSRQRGGRGGSYLSSKRQRDSDSDGFDMSDRRGSRSTTSSFSRGSMPNSVRRGSREDVELSPRRRENGYRGKVSSPRQRDSDSDGFARRGSRSTAGSFSRNSRGSMPTSVPRRQSFDEDVELNPRRRENGSRGAFSSPVKRGGRNSDSTYGRIRGGGTIQKGRKQALLTSDDDKDEDDELAPGFGDLLSDIDSEEDTDTELEDDDEELLPRRRGNGPSPVKSGGRDSDLSYGRGQGGGNLQKGRKQALLISDDDDDKEDHEDSAPNFGDFLSDEDNDKDLLEVKDVSSLHGSAKRDNTQSTPKISSGSTDSYLSETRFDQCAISPLSLKGIKDAGYERMTVVQAATLPVILKGKDVLAKAKTGTGKTVAFLLPAIEAIVKSPPVDRDQKRPPINVLVMCPTRELASQAAAEATKLLKYHPSIGVQIVIGGVRLALEQKRMQANPCQILVATPGRLKDHIENTAGFATRLMGVKVLVLDEADHLLDMGFRKDIEKIISAVPKQRQTLLFSATVPEDVRQICHVALKRDHEFINTVEEGSEETHAQVRQMNLVAPLDKQFSLLYALLKEHIADDVEFKVLVFCTTAMVTRLVADLLSELKLNVREIHSRKPQSYRTRVSDEFRKSKGLILVTSDVSARGVDYPDVTLVIQVGLPSDREQYIHRLGRTGRKGKEGQGILLLAPWEEFFLSSLRDLPMTKASVPSVDPDTKKKVERALSNVEMKNKESAYQAWLGYYNSNKTVGKDKCRLVELANEFSRSMGLDTPPAIPKLILGKMGLRNVPGLRTK